MKIIVEDSGGRTSVSVPDGYIAAINLPSGVTAGDCFIDRETWKDYLFVGPINVVRKEPIYSISMVKLDEVMK